MSTLHIHMKFYSRLTPTWHLRFPSSILTAGMQPRIRIRVELFIRPFLPFPLSPHQHRKGLGTKLQVYRSAPPLPTAVSFLWCHAESVEGWPDWSSQHWKVISALLSGKNCLVVHPTGSGKSLCFQFPPVFENKKAIVLTPTISLMQDQVANLDEKEIKAVYLGSAQL